MLYELLQDSLVVAFLSGGVVFALTSLQKKRELGLVKEQYGQLNSFHEKHHEKQLADLSLELKSSRDELVVLRGEHQNVLQLNAQLHTALTKERQGFEEKMALLEDTKQKMSGHFQALSLEALKSNNEQFLLIAESKLKEQQNIAFGNLEKHRADLNLIVKPLEESLKQVDAKVSEIEKSRQNAYSGLLEHLRNQQEAISRLHLETTNLSHALKSPKVQGSWGEIQLQRVVELAGMMSYCDFVEQAVTSDGRQRPDMVVSLPNNKQIVVDAKAPLKHYLEAHNSEDAAHRKQKFGEHARSVRGHIQQLASKNYWEQFKTTPDFVVLFLPGDVFLSCALEQDTELVEYGIRNRVILTTPATLIALLKAVHYGWKQEQIAESAKEILTMGRDLYERLFSLAEHFIDLRRSLERSVSSYNRAVGTLENRVLSSARRFQDLSKGSRELPPLEPIDVEPRELIKLERSS